MIKNIFATILVLLGVCYTTFAQSSPPKLYETEDYKIDFPGQYEKSSQTVASSLGELLMTIISYEPNSSVNDSNYVYMIMESKYPASSIHSDSTAIIEKFFRASIDGAVKNVDGKIIKEIKGSTGKYPNRTVDIDFQNGFAVIRMRMILRESKMIIIQSITNTEIYPNLSQQHFLESFKLK